MYLPMKTSAMLHDHTPGYARDQRLNGCEVILLGFAVLRRDPFSVLPSHIHL